MNTNKDGGYDMTKEPKPCDRDGSTAAPPYGHRHGFTGTHTPPLAGAHTPTPTLTHYTGTL